MKNWTFAYRARLVKVVDGDTIDVEIDRGFRDVLTQRLRLLGVNTPEMHDADPIKRAAAVAAKDYVIAWCDAALAASLVTGDKWELRIQTEKDDAFGRYLCRVWKADAYPSGVDLSAFLIADGHGVPFMV
jgi:micrococcal nuclease